MPSTKTLTFCKCREVTVLSETKPDQRIGIVVIAAVLTISALGGRPALAASCESLSSLSQPNTTITLAQTVAEGEFTPPDPTGSPAPGGSLYSKLPAFCRVAATLRPSSDSDIQDRSVAARLGLERQVPIRRQWRLGWIHQLSSTRSRCRRRLRHSQHGHRTHRKYGKICPRPSRKDD